MTLATVPVMTKPQDERTLRSLTGRNCTTQQHAASARFHVSSMTASAGVEKGNQIATGQLTEQPWELAFSRGSESLMMQPPVLPRYWHVPPHLHWRHKDRVTGPRQILAPTTCERASSVSWQMWSM